MENRKMLLCAIWLIAVSSAVMAGGSGESADNKSQGGRSGQTADDYVLSGMENILADNFDQAIADFTQALGLDSNNTDAYLYRGGSYFQKADYARARSDFEQVLRIDPGNQEALENLTVLKRMGYITTTASTAATASTATTGPAPKPTAAATPAATTGPAPKPTAAATPAATAPAATTGPAPKPTAAGTPAATAPAAATGSAPKPTAAGTPAATAPAAATSSAPKPTATATTTAPAAPSPPAPAPAAVTDESKLRAAIVAAARKYQGAKYVYGAMNPPSSFDCSGLVGQAYKDGANYTTPRSSTEIYKQGYKINAADLRPGDVVVYSTDGRGNPSHVSIWVDKTTFIHAVSAGSPTGVVVGSLTASWSSKIIGYRSFFSNGKLKPKSKSLTTALPITDFNLSISDRAQRETDPLPAAVNTAMRFTLYNETGKTENYMLYFYKTGTSRTEAESQELRINAGASAVSEFYAVNETGSYTLEVREKSGNTPRLERVWTVIQ